MYPKENEKAQLYHARAGMQTQQQKLSHQTLPGKYSYRFSSNLTSLLGQEKPFFNSYDSRPKRRADERVNDKRERDLTLFI